MNVKLKQSILMVLIFSLSSCSWVSSKRSLLGENGKKKDPQSRDQPLQMVSKDQYDGLLKKYELLQSRLQDQKLKGEVSESSPEDIADALNELQNRNSAQGELVETVDVFSGKKGLKRMGAVIPILPLSSAQITEEVTQLKKGRKLLAAKKFNEALGILRELEQSRVRQVRVRAKFLLGEILFVQKDYDLSMQIFEEIISQEAFSGVVLKALGRLIVCSQKLNLRKKQERYYSLLHDFFESA